MAVTGSCSRSITTTRSTASGSSRELAARRPAYCAKRRARSARRRAPAAALPDRHAGDHHNCSRTRGAVEFLRRAPSAGVDRAGASAWLGRPARRRRVRPNQQTGPERSGTQTSWRSRFTRCSDGQPGWAACSPADTLAKLERPWFSGGTIVVAFVQREYYQSAPGAAHFEDGTVNYPNLPAVEIGVRFLDRISVGTIHIRGSARSTPGCSTRWAR